MCLLRLFRSTRDALCNVTNGFPLPNPPRHRIPYQHIRDSRSAISRILLKIEAISYDVPKPRIILLTKTIKVLKLIRPMQKPFNRNLTNEEKALNHQINTIWN